MRIWNGNTKTRRVGSVVDSEIRCTGNHKLNIYVKVISAFIFVVEKSFGEVRECNFMNEHRLIAVSCLILSEFIDIPSEWLKVVLFYSNNSTRLNWIIVASFLIVLTSNYVKLWIETLTKVCMRGSHVGLWTCIF